MPFWDVQIEAIHSLEVEADTEAEAKAIATEEFLDESPAWWNEFNVEACLLEDD